MQRLVGGLIAAFAFALVPFAAAQDWPRKPIRLIVNVGAGGAPDVVARLYVPRLSEAPGHPVIVEKRAGAGSNIGVEAVAFPDTPTLHEAGSDMTAVSVVGIRGD